MKKNQTISFQVNGETDDREAVIMGRVGKACTNKKNWYNIEYSRPENLRGEQISIDLETVQNLNIVDPNTETGEDLNIADPNIETEEVLLSWFSGGKVHM